MKASNFSLAYVSFIKSALKCLFWTSSSHLKSWEALSFVKNNNIF